MNRLPFGVVTAKYDTAASITNALTTVQSFLNTTAFTPVAGRLYRCTYSIGYVQKTTNLGNINITMRKDTTAGTVLNNSVFSATGLGVLLPFSTSVLLTSTQMGTASFVPTLCIQANTAGVEATNTGGYNGSIIFEDIGEA